MGTIFIPGGPGQFDTIEIDGKVFRLDRKVESHRLMAALPRYRQAFEEVDESRVQENDPIELFDPPTLTQEQNGCTGHAASVAFRLAWEMSGQDVPEGGFSPTWAYALINDGQDQGAPIARLIEALQTKGMATNAAFGEKDYFLSQATPDDFADAAQYLLDDAYTISTVGELRSAASNGYSFVDSVQVGRNFTNLLGGTVAGVDVGWGNHAVAGAGLKKFQGRIFYPHKNSWGDSFAKAGRFYTTQDHILAQRDPMGNPTYTGVVFRSVKSLQPARSPVIATTGL